MQVTRLGALAAVLSASLLASATVVVAQAAASPAPTGLVLFVHAGAGGSWSSHRIDGIEAGSSSPSVASLGDKIVLAERATSGDVEVGEGTLVGAFTTVDLTATLEAPQAAGPPVLTTAGRSASIWYRTTSDDLEVATQLTSSSPWTLVDVSTL